MLASLALPWTHYSPVPDSDSLYHRLFSIPCMVEMLVREFVPQTLAAGLDFSRLQRVNPKFHTGRQSARRREADVIWRLPTREGTDLYLLFEFQSKIDWWMAVRAQIYQGLLWQQVIDERKLKTGERLPPLLLLVLYNGLMRWRAPTQIRKLIALSRDSALWPWQPEVRYHLLDVSAFSGDELARRHTLAALLFRLERSPRETEKFKGLLAEVSAWFRQHPGQERLRHLFAELIHRACQEFGKKPPGFHDWLETKMKSNIPTNIKAWIQHLLAEGKAEAIAKGRAEGQARGRIEGKAEGKAEALIHLLVAKFGALAPSLRTRIQRARLAILDRWFKRAIAASDLRSVFNSPR